jgi:dTDP-3-amino-2,3,6-trideoxy-4-keto-D-glucose/dTDP-3-amino-3,4,6-trideoxy-alpha-D-glucose/dTDP-2,6-dideoxy-D-kanosamine transaminase
MIKVWDYLREYHAEREEVDAAIRQVLESGTLILGANVRDFEAAFAAYCGCRHGVGVNSGTDALFLALRALGIGAGDEVITVANTAVPTVSAVEATGARTRFVDIDPATYLMDTSRLEGAVTERTRCIIAVHLFGQCVDMDAVQAVAQRHGLSVIEDCAQAHGARYRGKVAGSMSELSAFSFYPTKILGGYGDGGMILANSPELDARCRRLRFYGMDKQYYSLEQGYNSRLDELHAAILLRKLAHLDAYIARRRQLAELYRRELAGTELQLPAVAADNFHSYYLFVCRHPRRDFILQYLKDRNIVLNISYPWPIHVMPTYAHLGYAAGDLPATEAAAKEIFSLPMFPSLADTEALQTCEALKDALAQAQAG